MTKREVFEKVKAHLLTQRAKAVDGGGFQCRYKNGNGQKCAVGCLIPDERYTEGMEGITLAIVPYTWTGWVNHPLGEALNAAGVPVSAREMLCALQQLHDRTEVRDWEQNLIAVEAVFLDEEAP